MFDDIGKSKLRLEIWQLFIQPVLNFFCYVCVYALLPIIISMLIGCIMLRQLVHIYLQLKHGPSYGGLIINENLMYPPEKPEKSVINTVMIADLKSNSFQDFISHVKLLLKRNIFDCPESNPKLTYTFSSFLGFSYLLKKDLYLEDCLSVIDVTTDSISDESLLKDTLNNCCNRSLPKDGSILWEIIILSKPIKWIVDDSENEISGYLIIVRCNHMIGDGTSLMAVFTNILGLKESFPSRYMDNMHTQKNKPAENSMKTLKKFLSIIYLAMVTPYLLLYNVILRKEGTNMLHAEKLATENVFVYKVEKTHVLLDMVKRMKSTIPDTTFTDFILTAISGSLETLFKNNSQYPPDFITITLTALQKPPVWNKTPLLENNFVLANMNFPICSDSTTMLQKLMLVKKHRDILKNSNDYQVNSFAGKIMLKLVPTLLLKPLMRFDNVTMVVTNLPGPSKLCALDNISIISVLGFVPIPGKIGASIGILTYDDRFQIALTVNKALISQESAQALVDDVFNNLYLLNDEVQKRYS